MSGLLIRVRPSIRAIRSFRTNSLLRDAKPESTPGSKPQGSANAKYLSGEHYVTDFEKRILVFAKKYPNVKDVPDKISSDLMQNCMSKARIRLANYMIVLTLAACLIVVISGNMKKNNKLEEMQLQHDEFRRQITAEFKESVKHDAGKK